MKRRPAATTVTASSSVSGALRFDRKPSAPSWSARLAALGWVGHEPELYAALGVPSPSPHAALLLAVFASPPFWFFVTPRANAATLTPDRVHSAFYDTHPPAIQRIARLAARQA